MIKPSVGDSVLFTPTKGTPGEGSVKHAAIVAFVHSGTCVNLTIFDANGNVYGQTSVPLCQEEENRPNGFYCEYRSVVEQGPEVLPTEKMVEE